MKASFDSRLCQGITNLREGALQGCFLEFLKFFSKTQAEFLKKEFIFGR